MPLPKAKSATNRPQSSTEWPTDTETLEQFVDRCLKNFLGRRTEDGAGLAKGEGPDRGGQNEERQAPASPRDRRWDEDPKDRSLGRPRGYFPLHGGL